MGSNHLSCGRWRFRSYTTRPPSSASMRTCTHESQSHSWTRFCTEPAFSLCRASSSASLASKQAAWHLTQKCVEDTTKMRNCEQLWTRSFNKNSQWQTTIRFQSCKNRAEWHCALLISANVGALQISPHSSPMHHSFASTSSWDLNARFTALQSS